MSFNGPNQTPDGGPARPRPEVRGGPPAQPAPTLSFGELVGMLRRHVALIVVVFLLIAGSGIGLTIYLWKTAPEYAAEATIAVHTGTTRVGTGDIPEVADQVPVGQIEQFINNQVQLIREEHVLQRALTEGLAEQIISELSFEDSERTMQSDQAIRERARRVANNYQKVLGTGGDPALRLRQRISVSNPFRTSVIAVRLQGEDRQLIADIANSVVDSYMLAYSQQRKRRERARLSGLRERLGTMANSLQRAEDALRSFREESEYVMLTRLTTDVQNKLSIYEQALAESELQMLRMYTLWQQLQARGEDSAISPEIQLRMETDPTLVRLKETENVLMREKEQRLENFGSRHEEVKAVERRLATVRAQIENRTSDLQATMIRQQREQTEAEYQAARAQYEQVQQTYERLRERVKDLTTRNIRYQTLLNEYENLRDDVRLLDEQILRQSVAVEVTANSVGIRSVAREPDAEDKVSPRLTLYVPGSVMLALVVAVALGLLVELIDNRVRTPAQLVRTAGLGVLGTVPDRREDPTGISRDAELGLVAGDKPQSLLAESFRQLRTSLLYSTDTDLRTLLITSPKASDGKTIVASNLAITLASGGSKTLLIDTNFRRPQVHRIFDQPNSVGLSSVLARLNPLEEAIQNTQVPNLDVLACGPQPPSPGDLLGSEAMQNLLQEVAGLYDNIVLDGPPILVVSDANVLCGMVDGVAVVVNSEQTSRGMAQRTRRTLFGFKARVVGAVLNRVRARKGGYFRESFRSYYDYAASQQR